MSGSATVIDALIVELGLDASKFTAGQKEAVDGLKGIESEAKKFDRVRQEADQENKKRDAEKRRNETAAERQKRKEETEAQRARDKDRAEQTRKEKDAALERTKADRQAAKERKEGYDKVKEAALGFGAAIAGVATARFIQSTAQDVAALGRTAHNLDMSSGDVRAWGNAVKEIGGSADEAVGSLQGLQGRLVAMKTGDFSLMEPLAKLSAVSGHVIAPLDEKNNPVSAIELLKRIMEATKGMDPATRASMLSGLGLDSGTINAGQGGRAGIDAAIAAAIKRGVPNDAEAQQDARLAKAAADLEQKFGRLGELLVLRFGPDLLRFLADLESLIEVISGHKSFSDFQADRKQHFHDSQVQQLIGRGMTPFEAEARVRIAESRGQDATALPDVQPSGFGNRVMRFLGMPAGFAPSAGLPADIEAEVRRDAIAKGVDPDHMVALFRAEGGGYNKTSSAGAFGPAQLMPKTAQMMGLATNPNAPDYDWRQNVAGGVRYWAGLVQHYNGNLAAADAAYNAGPSGRGVDAFAATGDLSGLPTETQKYVRQIQTNLGSAAAPVSSGSGGDTNTATTHIGKVEVHVPNGDANAIAQGMRDALKSHPLVVQANTGQE